MATIKEQDFKEQHFKEIFDFSRSLQQYYYSCRLENPDNNKNDFGWKCSKFTNLSEAQKFASENSEKTVLTKIIPAKCGNPFNAFEKNILNDKLIMPIEVINQDNNN